MVNQFENQESSSIHKEDQPIKLNEIIEKAIYHWPVFCIALVICLGLAYLYLRYTKPIYEVSTTILIKDQKKGGMPSSDILGDLDVFSGSKVVENEMDILKSKTLMRSVVNRLNLMVNFKVEGRVITSDIYEDRPVNFIALRLDSLMYNKSWDLTFPDTSHYLLSNEKGKKISGELNKIQSNILGIYKIDKAIAFDRKNNEPLTLVILNPDDVADANLNKLSIELTNKMSTVLKLTYNVVQPKQGADILNMLTQVYNEAALADKNRTTQSTMDFIDQRLNLISGELTEVEKDVEGFKSSQGLTNITSEANLFLENVRVNDAKLNEINIQIGVVNDIQKYVDSKTSYEKLPSTFGINDPVLLGQINQLRELQMRRDALLSTTEESNPLFNPINRQIETTRAGINSGVKNIMTSLLSTKQELEKYNQQYEQSIKKIPGQERQYVSIQRQQTIKQNLYLFLLQKKEEAALSYASAVADNRIVDPAYISKTPILPKRSLTYAMAFVLSLMLPAGYLYGKSLMNTRVESRSDISKITETPILGDIVFSDSSEPIVVTPTSRTAISEQFRAIRTNLQFIHKKNNNGLGNVTLFTSSMSGEGKSFVATNVAASLAMSGKKTVLLELDLRKPKVSKYLNLNKGSGLSNYLVGTSKVNEIIQPSGQNKNFFVVGSGPVPPNPSELLIQPEMDELISYLRKEYDEILIDTAPIGLVTDAQILSRLVDTSIYVVRQDITYKRQLYLLESLRVEGKFPKLSVIFNGITSGAGGYGYGYGYGHGYYSDDVEKSTFNFKSAFKSFKMRF